MLCGSFISLCLVIRGRLGKRGDRYVVELNWSRSDHAMYLDW